MERDITLLYYCIDEFCKIYKEWEKNKLIDSGRCRQREGKLSLSEMLTIVIYYHMSNYKNFKSYYLIEIRNRQKDQFKDIPCYKRFIQIMPKLIVPLSILIHYLKGEETGEYIIDSTKLSVCHNRRIMRHKTFKDIAERGKTTMGWFYGFKLHMVINNKGQVMAVKITRGNIDDRKFVPELTKNLKGVLLADKGYISQKLFNKLYSQGLKIICGVKQSMKNYLLSLNEKIAHRKRFLIETIFGRLKFQANLEHSRHRSFNNFIVNTLAAVASYSLSFKLTTFRLP